MSCKKYVDVTAIFRSDGAILPLEIRWEDGRRYPIDRVLDIRRAASLKAGGAGIRYTCRIGGRPKYLFLEENKWFVEAKEARDEGKGRLWRARESLEEPNQKLETGKGMKNPRPWAGVHDFTGPQCGRQTLYADISGGGAGLQRFILRLSGFFQSAILSPS